jgi:hypothetical protein
MPKKPTIAELERRRQEIMDQIMSNMGKNNLELVKDLDRVSALIHEQQVKRAFGRNRN